MAIGLPIDSTLRTSEEWQMTLMWISVLFSSLGFGPTIKRNVEADMGMEGNGNELSGAIREWGWFFKCVNFGNGNGMDLAGMGGVGNTEKHSRTSLHNIHQPPTSTQPPILSGMTHSVTQEVNHRVSHITSPNTDQPTTRLKRAKIFNKHQTDLAKGGIDCLHSPDTSSNL